MILFHRHRWYLSNVKILRIDNVPVMVSYVLACRCGKKGYVDTDDPEIVGAARCGADRKTLFKLGREKLAALRKCNYYMGVFV